MRRKPALTWLNKPEDHDYPAAASFLALIYDDKTVKKLVKALRKAPMTTFKAKDIFRSSGLPLLGNSNSHVEKDTARIDAGQRLSPLLLVRDPLHGKTVIADGYHRMCAIYAKDEDAVIPCKIA